jgi:predicted transcriptional regulator
MIYSDIICKDIVSKRSNLMKKAVNLRLDESVIIALDKLSTDFKTTKTDIIERAIKLFSSKNSKNQNELLQFAGTLNSDEADKMLDSIQSSKNSKDFSLDI